MDPNEEPQEIDHCNEIMAKIGYDGFFQKMFKIIYVCGLTIFSAMLYMNIILALSIPNHWCHVPGRERTNFTMQEWKQITLPKEENNKGEKTFSLCSMYDLNYTDIQYWDYETWNYSDVPVTTCKHGYDYDREWFLSTIVTQEDWVCEKDLYVTHAFTVGRIGEVVGTFIFGQLGDTIGRKAVFYITAVLSVVGRVVSILSTSSFILFAIAAIATSLAVNSIFQSPLVIAMEISQEDDRANIAMVQNLGWSIGACSMPLIYWYFREWMPFMWISSIPVGLFLLFKRFMVESPRWLISRRRFKDAIKQFRIIARINRKEFHMTEQELAEMYSSMKEEQIYGMMSLFSGWRIARNALIMALNWCVVVVSYFTLLLYCSSMSGNPFLNFLLQTVVEVPSNFIGTYFSNRIGRRFTSCFSYLVAAVFCLPLIILAKRPNMETVVLSLAMSLKFLNGITFLSMNLQAMETYPTCLRQSGLALGAIAGNSIGVVSPFVVYLGSTYDIRYPFYILLTIYIVGASTVLFLPETLHHKLPDSLKEAQVFGKGQKFWRIPRPTADHLPEMEKMNTKKFAP